MQPLASVGDELSDLLRAESVRSSVFCLSELRAPWGFHVERDDIAKFHLVLTGRGLLSVEGHDDVTVEAGDLVLLARGHAHTLRDASGSETPPLGQLLLEHPLEPGDRLRYGGHGELTRLLCGGFALGREHPSVLQSLIPDVVVVEAAAVAATSWLEPVLQGLLEEIEGNMPGSGAVQAKIADVFLTQALRCWMIGAERAALVRLGEVSDEPIRMALDALRAGYLQPWSLHKLASQVGLSRTALATRFRAAVGESPMRHLARVRLAKAAGYLSTTRLTLYQIAHKTGYADNAALSKAFRREFGQSPGAYRAASRRPPEIRLREAEESPV